MSERPGSNPARRPRSSVRPRLRNQVLFVFGILILAAGAFYTALVVATKIDQIFFPDSHLNLGAIGDVLPGLNGSQDNGDIGGGRINILVMGIDARPGEGDLGRSDTMFVMSIDPDTKTARGLAIPRDTYVDIPTKSGNTTFKDRVNTAWIYGESEKRPGGGAALAKTVVENLLGIKIDHYVLIDFSGFKQLVDMLGGVDVDVPVPLNDRLYSETEKPGDYYPCVFDVGVHHMNGSDALCYSRSRNTTDDFDRIQRQQRVMYAIMSKANDLHLLADPTNLVSLWKRYKDMVHTDINDLLVPGFARIAAGIGPDNMAFLSLAAAETPYVTPAGADVLLPSKAGIKQIVDAMLSDRRLAQESAVVEVQNGTSVTGAAAKAVDYLTNLGLSKDAVVATDAADSNHSKTEIIDFSGKSYTAGRLATWLGVPKDRVRKALVTDEPLRTTPNADIVVILGTDAHLESALASGQ